MATNKRTYPNSYFAWYNDDNRIAILTQDTTSTGERTSEKYDTFQGDGNLGGTIHTVLQTDTDDADTDNWARFTTHSPHYLVTGDNVTIAGTTNFNDDDLSGNFIYLESPSGYTSTTSFNMKLIDRDPEPNEVNITGATWAALSSYPLTAGRVANGLRITFHAKYEEATLTTNNLQSDLGLDSALHNAVLCYVKSRLYEDDEDLEYSQYFRKMYEQKIKKFRGRRSAVRHLAVTRL